MTSLLDTKLTPLDGLHDFHLSLLKDELRISTYRHLLTHYPLRYEDKKMPSSLEKIPARGKYLFSKGSLDPLRISQMGRRTVLVSRLTGKEGSIPLLWFNKIDTLRSCLKPHHTYYIYGKVSSYGGKGLLVHPELTLVDKDEDEPIPCLSAVYPTNAKLSKAGLDSKGIRKLQRRVIDKVADRMEESLPDHLIERHRLIPRSLAFRFIHFPYDFSSLHFSKRRLKFEELLFLQLRLSRQTHDLAQKSKGFSFSDVRLIQQFYATSMPFSLTPAQKKVIKEIYGDMKSGFQMNRLLQGDVGSGKTIVAFITSLLPLATGAQVALMAPTELLAQQHAHAFAEYAKPLGIEVALLTGSVSGGARKNILKRLHDGELKLLIGTHALLGTHVRFAQLGLVIIDEQHRFGVAQRAQLWSKSTSDIEPHLLVMTATPIPRTLAMTLYSGLAKSVIDQLPPARKPVRTYHVTDAGRLSLFAFLEKKIEEGRQVYIVYPLIEKSGKMDYKYLMDGYESIRRRFPQWPIGILHGRMKMEDKSYEMKRFLKGETKIMVTTTVIEVGVNVRNATVMVIENAEKFGLIQLHQLRGRIKRGDEEGHCILVTGDQVSDGARARIQAMRKTDDGFKIAEHDLKLRGPGNLVGVEQSGLFKSLKMVNMSDDFVLVKEVQKLSLKLLANDPNFTNPYHLPIRKELECLDGDPVNWGKVS